MVNKYTEGPYFDQLDDYSLFAWVRDHHPDHHPRLIFFVRQFSGLLEIYFYAFGFVLPYNPRWHTLEQMDIILNKMKMYIFYIHIHLKKISTDISNNR